jgi:hypothetical protein
MPTTVRRDGDRVLVIFPHGTELEFRFPAGAPGGLFRVGAGGLPLRDATHPQEPVISSEEGLTFHPEALQAVEQDGDAVTLVLAMRAQVEHYRERGDWYNSCISTEQLDRPCRAVVRWTVAPKSVTIGGETLHGFSYRFQAESPEVDIHHLLDRQNWEIGGAASGNTVINRGGYIRPEHTATLDSRHTTSEEFLRVRQRFFTYMQLRPRFGYVQCFDYQTGPRGTLLMYFERPTAIRSLLHKEPGRDRFQYYDDHWVRSASSLETTWRHVVFLPTTGEDLWHGRNRWLRCWDFCAQHYRDAYGMHEGEPEPGFAMQYWTTDMARNRAFNEVVRGLLPQMAKLGFTQWFMPHFFDSNMLAMKGIDPNHITSHNPCCPRDFVWHAEIGGAAWVKQVLAEARGHGLIPQQWISAHMACESPVAPLLNEHPEWMVRSHNGAPFDGHARVAACVDINSGYGAHYRQRLLDMLKDGVGNFFADSYPNFNMLPVNYATPGLEPQQDAVLRIQSDCQKAGAEWYVEGESPFGISANGLAGPILGSRTERDHGEVQNLHRDNWTLDNFTGERQFVLYKTCLATALNDLKSGAFPVELLFRFLAFKAPFRFGFELKDPIEVFAPELGIGPDGILDAARRCLDGVPPAAAAMLHAYNRVRPGMASAQILPGYAGSLWLDRSGALRTVFAFTTASLPVAAGAKVEVVHGGGTVVVADGALALQPGCIYRIRG